MFYLSKENSYTGVEKTSICFLFQGILRIILHVPWLVHWPSISNTLLTITRARRAYLGIMSSQYIQENNERLVGFKAEAFA